jgi:CRISPR/Cas system-associated exonuclease Cas4 (RecB family)
VGSDPRWITPSELAEFAYCPRAHYYRLRYGPEPASADSERGERYHRQVLGAELRRATRGANYWMLVAVGSLLTVGGVVAFLWR